MLRVPVLMAALALSVAAQAQTDHELAPVYADAGQYTATLDRGSQHWQLEPIAGEAIEVRGGELCPRTAVPAPGLWLLGRDSQGRPELIAPSATLLPEGHSGRVALRSCDDPELRSAQVDAYGVPGQLLDLLVANTGAVLVND